LITAAVLKLRGRNTSTCNAKVGVCAKTVWRLEKSGARLGRRAETRRK
jgi:hypothetical protein